MFFQHFSYGISSIFLDQNTIAGPMLITFFCCFDRFNGFFCSCFFWCDRLLCAMDAPVWCAFDTFSVSSRLFSFLLFDRSVLFHDPVNVFSRRLCRCEQRKTVVHLIVSLFDRLNFSFCSTLNTETKHVSLWLFYISFYVGRHGVCVSVVLSKIVSSGIYIHEWVNRFSFRVRIDSDARSILWHIFPLFVFSSSVYKHSHAFWL